MSLVFRAVILSDMEEGKKGNMFIPDMDEKTLGTVIVTLFSKQMKEVVDIKGETIADLLILAHKHGKEELRELAVERIKADRLVCQEEGFKERMEGAPAAIWIDLLKDL